ncbi:hypothetical protein M9434_001650 [Picochlorum sp. BPE23]|nr:hypothetical protein M9434_001650 [Picochlorum sp. BPE23]
METIEKRNEDYIRCLDLVQKYIKQRKEIDDLIREGFVGLTKFKYSDSRSLRGLQSYFPKRMIATRKIRIRGCDGGPQVELCDTRKSQEVDKEDCRDPDDEVRDFIKELESRYVTSSGDRRQSHDDLDDVVMTDPLEWFGGICHPSLKQSAEIFGAVIDKVEDLAQIIYNLQISLRQYQENKTRDTTNTSVC